MNKNKKKTVLKLGKETYGTRNIKEAFTEAFKPYFNKEQSYTNYSNDQRKDNHLG